MPEPILRGDAGRKLVTQWRELPCSPAGKLIRTFVRTEYTPTSFQSQAVIPADQIRSRDYIAVCRRSRGHWWCARIEGPSTATSAGNRSYVYGSDAFLPD